MTVCHLHYAKSEEQNINDDMNSSDQMNLGTDCMDTDCIDTDCIITDCNYTDCIAKDCNNANFKHANCIDTDHVIQICTVPIHMI